MEKNREYQLRKYGKKWPNIVTPVVHLTAEERLLLDMRNIASMIDEAYDGVLVSLTKLEMPEEGGEIRFVVNKISGRDVCGEGLNTTEVEKTRLCEYLLSIPHIYTKKCRTCGSTLPVIVTLFGMSNRRYFSTWMIYCKSCNAIHAAKRIRRNYKYLWS